MRNENCMENPEQVNNIDNNKVLIEQGFFDTKNEKWKLIKNLNDYYAVSTCGRIMSMRDRRIMKLSTKKDGYKLLVASINGKKIGLHVHRLVAQAFIPNPLNLPVVNHKDENPANNNISNLEWCTWQYNNTYNNIQNRRKKINKNVWNKGKSLKENTSSIIMKEDDNNIYFSCISEAATYLSEKENMEFKTAYARIYKALNNKNNICCNRKWQHVS